MNKPFFLSLGLALLLAAGCAKENTASTGATAQAYLQTWVREFHPELQPNADGLYVMADQAGTGPLWDGSHGYTLGYVTIRTLGGTISATDEEVLAQQLGTWKEGNYYGPRVFATGEGISYAGVDALLNGMRLGGTRTAIVPAWMITQYRYGTQQEYIDAATSSTSLIYTITPESQFDNLDRWEKDSVLTYARRHYGADIVSQIIPGQESADSTLYFVTDSSAFIGRHTFERDTTLRINYTGRLLNGQVFDTSVAEVAVAARIYDESRTYAPLSIVYASNYDSIKTADGTDLIDGFQIGLYRMRWTGQKAVVLFTSSLGYAATGSGDVIPPYAPLLYELEILAD